MGFQTDGSGQEVWKALCSVYVLTGCLFVFCGVVGNILTGIRYGGEELSSGWKYHITKYLVHNMPEAKAFGHHCSSRIKITKSFVWVYDFFYQDDGLGGPRTVRH